MPTIDDILSSGRRRRRSPEPTLSQLEALTPREGPLTTLALAAPRAAMTVLDALDYVDSTTRAGIGALAGVEGSGRETIFGNAPSGRELLGLGEGERGTFESGDVPGLAAELTLSPFNLLSLGTTTAAGQSAKSLARLGRAESAYRAMGLAEKADALLPRIAALEGELNAGGHALEYGRTAGEQARRGQRALLQLDVPFGPKATLLRGAPVLDALETGYNQTLGRVARPVYDRIFRPAGKIGNEAFDELVDLGSREGASEGAAWGRETARDIGRELPKLSATTDDVADVAERFRYGAAMAGREYESQFGRPLSPQAQRALDVGTSLGESTLAPNESLTLTALEHVLPAEKMRTAAKSIEEGLVAQANARIERVAWPKDRLEKIGRLIYDGLDPEKTQAAQRLAEKLDPQSRRILQEARKYYDQGRPPKGWMHQLDQAGGAVDADARARSIADAIEGINRQRVERATARAQRRAAAKVYPLLAKAAIADDVAKVLPNDVLQTAARYAAINGQDLALTRAAGVRVGELTDPLLGYLQHTTSTVGRELSQLFETMGIGDGELGRVARQFATSADFTKRRSEALRGLGVLQANDLLGDQARRQAEYVLQAGTATAQQKAAAQRVITILDKGGRFFEENLPAITLRRLTQGGEVRGNARLMQGVLGQFAMDQAAAGPGALSSKEFIERADLMRVGDTDLATPGKTLTQMLEHAGLADAYIPKHVADAALKVDRALQDPAAVTGVLGLFNTVNGLARLAATLPRPGYYARNLLGNVFNMWLGGFRNPGRIVDAYDLLRREAQGALSEAEQAMMRRAVTLGAVDTGATLELRQLTDEAGLLGDRTAVQRSLSNLADRGLDFNRRIENTSKLAMYLDGKSKGLSDLEAAERVKTYLFDYTDLSHVEKSYLRRGAFFYTFTRKNIPLQISHLLADPRRLRLYGALTGRLGESIQNDILPAWQQDQGLISIGQDDEGNQAFIGLGLPGEDLFRWSDEGRGLGRVGQKALGMLVPTLKAPIELSTNVNLGTGLPTRPRPSDNAIASLLPEGIGQDLTTLAALETYGPTAGVTGPLKRLGEALTGNSGTSNATPLDALLSIFGGVSTSRVSPAEGRERQKREAANILLDRLGRAGAEKDDPRAREARRALR